MNIQNALQCPDETYLVSLSVHDYQTHNGFMVDGGLEYFRGNVLNKAAANLCLDIHSSMEDICNKLICEETRKPWREILSKKKIQEYRLKILNHYHGKEHHGYKEHTTHHAFLHLYVSGYWIVQHHKSGILKE